MKIHISNTFLIHLHYTRYLIKCQCFLQTDVLPISKAAFTKKPPSARISHSAAFNKYLLRINNSVRVLQSSFADVHRSGIRRAPLFQQLYVRSYGTPIP